jgi:hypothetical protein
MRMAPRTAKAGSSFVARMMGAGVGVGEVVDVFEGAEEVVVGVMILVALNTVGTTVVTGMFDGPERVTVAIVTELVVRTSETLGVEDVELREEDWADTDRNKEIVVKRHKRMTERMVLVVDMKPAKTAEPELVLRLGNKRPLIK